MPKRRELTGWVKLYRKYLKNPIWEDDPANRVFLWLLMAAEHKAKIERVGTREIALQRGQVLTSHREMVAGTGVSRMHLRSILRGLESDRAILYQANPRYSLITVLNYSFYQGEEGSTERENLRPALAKAKKQPKRQPSKSAKISPSNTSRNIFNYQTIATRGELPGAKANHENEPNFQPKSQPALYKEEEVKEDLRKPPPNPPPAGGRDFSFSESEQAVLRLWSECRTEAGESYFEDKGTVRGARRMAELWLDPGKVTLDQIREAMRNFIHEVKTNTKARLFDLATLAGSLSKYLDAAAMKKSAPAERKVLWRWRCDRCGHEAVGNYPADKGTPRSYHCDNSFKRACGGTMQPAREDSA